MKSQIFQKLDVNLFTIQIIGQVKNLLVLDPQLIHLMEKNVDGILPIMQYI